MHPRHLIRTPLASVLLLAALLGLSCGRDGESPNASASESTSRSALMAPTPGRYAEESSNPPPRSTPTQLLTTYFEDVYEARDSVLYAAMLDRKFQFQFLPEDADSLRDILGADDFWKKRLDLQSTGAMFRDPSVTSVLLNILPQSNVEYTGDDCDGCREIFSMVALRVTVLRDGDYPLSFAVDSWQDFVVKPDPIEPSKWVLFRQLDVPLSMAPSQALADTIFEIEPVSWGELKALYFPR